MIYEWFRIKNRSEIFMALYIIIGFLLITIASKIESINSLVKISENIFPIIASLILVIMSGIVTYFIRMNFFKLDHSIIIDNANEFTKASLWNIVNAFSLASLGFVALLLHPTSTNFLYIMLVAILIMIICLNTYLSGFWLKRIRSKDSIINIDVLKLEHGEWSHFFNNICLAFFVTISGIFITYYLTLNESSLLVSNNDIFHVLNTYINPILIVYVTFVTPIFWLLRPIHNVMNKIRKEMVEVKKD